MAETEMRKKIRRQAVYTIMPAIDYDCWLKGTIDAMELRVKEQIKFATLARRKSMQDSELCI